MTPIHARSARSPSVGQAVDPPGLAGLGRAGPRLDQAVALRAGPGRGTRSDDRRGRSAAPPGPWPGGSRSPAPRTAGAGAPGAGSGAAVPARSATAAPRIGAPMLHRSPGLCPPGDERPGRPLRTVPGRKVSMSARVRRPISPLQPDLAGSRSRSCVRSPREPVPTSSRSLRLRLRHPHPDRRRPRTSRRCWPATRPDPRCRRSRTPSAGSPAPRRRTPGTSACRSGG